MQNHYENAVFMITILTTTGSTGEFWFCREVVAAAYRYYYNIRFIIFVK